MSKKILVVMFLFTILLHATVASAIGFNYVQIFDPKQDKVVKVVQVNDEIYNMVVRSIRNVDVLYVKINPLTDDGYAVRVPMNPAVRVQGKCLNALIDNVFIIIPQHNIPFFMIYEDHKKLFCFPFKGDVDALSKILDFKLKS